MAPQKLRIVYASDDQLDAQAAPATSTQVTIRLEEVFPILAEALTQRRGWLDDFADDRVTISSDLYEVLLAYEHHRGRAA
jgi:hypothetical protein